MKLNSILCATDFSDVADHAVGYGIALAKKFEAKLYLCHVIDLSRASPFGDTEGIENRIRDYAVERLGRSTGGSAVNWESLIAKGAVPGEIARLAERLSVNLAIAGNHGQSGFKRLVLGSVTERLMRTLPCPLLVVDGPQHDFVGADDFEIKLNRILVGCDFSPHSSLAIQYALSLAREFGCELHLAHVFESTLYDDLVKSLTTPEEDRESALRRELKTKLAQMAPAETDGGYSPSTTLLAGQPYQELTLYAVRQDIDLIVLGVRGHSLRETLHLGSTADRVIRQAPCPVLSVCPTCSRLWFE